MPTITSPHNEKLKLIRRLGRRRSREREGLFVGEGEDLLAAARAAGAEPVELLDRSGRGPGRHGGGAGAARPLLQARLGDAGHRGLAGGLGRGRDRALRLSARRLRPRQRRHGDSHRERTCRRFRGPRPGLRRSLRRSRRPREHGRALRRAPAAGRDRRDSGAARRTGGPRRRVPGGARRNARPSVSAPSATVSPPPPSSTATRE